MGAPKTKLDVLANPVSLQMAERLAEVPFFSNFPMSLIQEIAEICEVVLFEDGEEILRQGQFNSSLYLLIEGSAHVYVDGGKVAELEEFGDLIGEMSVINSRPSTGTVVAVESAELFRIGISDIENMSQGDRERFQHTLARIYASVLVDKLDATNHKAKHFEKINDQLKEAKTELESINSDLEKKVQERTEIIQKRSQDLIDSHSKLETQNLKLVAANKKLQELYSTKKITFSRLQELYKDHLIPLQVTLNDLQARASDEYKEDVTKAGLEVFEVISLLEPITSLYQSEQAMEAQKVLLADSNKKQQILAKMALGGTGIELEIAGTEDEAIEAVKSTTFDIIFADETMFSFIDQINEVSPTSEVVLMTDDAVPNYIEKLKGLKFLPNIVSRNAADRAFTMKNIVTSVSKLTMKDIFGTEKYLSWGTEIKTVTVKASAERSDYISQAENYFQKLGVRRSHRDRASLVLEELLMNAIYDAPTDEEGNSVYNHLDRGESIKLPQKYQANMSYGTDGMLMAISVRDPNGSLKGEIILNYLESCYKGEAGKFQANKGGAGRGLHQIIENSDLVVFNIRPGVSTEVIALFNLDQKGGIEKDPSFHLFIK